MHKRQGLIGAALAALVVGVGATTAQAATGPCSDPSGRPWCDPALSAEKRAGLLVKAMTQDEKITMLSGVSGTAHTGATAAIPRLGVPQSYNTDGPVGIRQGQATAMPTPMGLAATFDTDLAHLYGSVLGNEARAKANDGILAPTVNIMRVPYNGRTFEAFGEDPFLVARTTVAWVEGAQSQGVYATVKHFAANNQEGKDLTGHGGDPTTPLGGGQVNVRYLEDSVVDDRTLHEIYLPQFEAAVREAHALSLMCSYNRINGPWACSSAPLLTNVLRHEWGFKGLLMSDWLLATHTFDTIPALNNGLDLEMPFANAFTPLLVNAAVAAQLVPQAAIDEHVKRLFYTLFKIGFFDRPTTMPDDGLIDKAQHAMAAERVEEGAITLLKNDGALPLDAGRMKSIAVLGPDADKFVTGGGSGNVSPFSVKTVLAGIKDRVGPGVTVKYADGSDPAAAAALAASSDAAVVVVGDYETEGADRTCLTLECPSTNGNQDGLIDAVAAAQPNTTVVLQTGGPVLTPWLSKVKGLLEAWYPGMSGGTAVARVLFGDAEPAGRLPVTFPKSEADLQVAGDSSRYPGSLLGEVSYSEGVLNGYRWFDEKGIEPRFPFGFGLSYTTWRYGRLTVAPASDGSTAGTASITVTNTGSRAGVETPQLYLSLPAPAQDVIQPPVQLKGYAKVKLAPGKSTKVTFPITARDLSYWDSDVGDWAIAPGCYGVKVGRSSRDVQQQAVVAVGGASCAGAATSLPGAAHVCAARRVVTLALRGLRGRKVRSVTVYRDGKRVRTLRGNRRTVRVLLPGGTGRVRLVITTRSGRRIVNTRRYRRC